MPKEQEAELSMEPLTFKHDPANMRFYYPSEHGDAELLYSKAEDNPNVLIYHHIFVPPELRGKAISTKLAVFAFDYAINNQKRLVLSCSYLKKKFFPKHKEKYKDIVRDSL